MAAACCSPGFTFRNVIMYDVVDVTDVAVKLKASQLTITELLQDKKIETTKTARNWKLHFSEVPTSTHAIGRSLPKRVILQEKIYN